MTQYPKLLVFTVIGLLSVALRAVEFQWKGVRFDLSGEYHATIKQGIDSVGGKIVLKEPKLTILCDSGNGAGNVVKQRREYSKSKPLRDEKLKLGDLTCEIWIGGPYPQKSGEPHYDACAYVNGKYSAYGMNFVGYCQGDEQLKVFMSFVMSAKPIAFHNDAGKGESHPISQEDKKAEQGGTVQPATRPVVEPEGGDKPQPEAKGRSR